MCQRTLIFLALAVSLAGAFAAEAPSVTDGEVWNEGVDFYRAGDVTNALRVLRPLLVSKTHAARAAELVARLAHDAAHADAVKGPETDGATRLESLEESARAAQIALRAAPGDAKAERNFSRSVDGLAELRENVRISKILKASEGQDPGALMRAAAVSARALMSEAGGFLTNRPARVVALSDACGEKAARLADAWLPLKETICRSVTNREQAATIVQQVDAARERTLRAARAFGDLDPEAYGAMSEVETDLTRFYKMTVLPPGAIDEDLLAQSNAWQDVAAFNGRSWQQDALDFTRAFRSKFPAWARAYEQQAQADTNKPPFTAEDQAKVSALATRLEKLQLECVESVQPPQQEEAVKIALEIRDLLPKDRNGGGGQNQQQQQNPQQQQDKNQQRQQKQDQQQQQQDAQSDPKQQEDPQQQEQQDEKPGEEDGEKPEDKDVEAVLKAAQERNDEHEAEKKARMRKAPLPPNERDW